MKPAVLAVQALVVVDNTADGVDDDNCNVVLSNMHPNGLSLRHGVFDRLPYKVVYDGYGVKPYEMWDSTNWIA